ncbi:MAG: tRNA (N(6)-L-threonylcarbamoyladenosine(37)-C(2))-methylthiotransferase MtaB [Saccharofermentans sp.]|nr:tRNA (N(6)-L-threonylcarbamoyladenosine(37)-C(2))-methylthiotransferase MtaB [Saccharofermentans sp.]
MKVYFYTLGCRVNQYETDAARELFIKAGFEIADSAEDADVCVVNTCTVTGEADRKSRQQLRRMARINPDTIVVAMGCMTEMAEAVIDADVVCGTKDKTSVVEKTLEYISRKSGGESLSRGVMHHRPEVTKKDDYHEFGTVLSPEGTRAFIKVEDGCNKFCTYCIIPFARGRVASRAEDAVLKEAQDLASRGYSEVIVSGIHVCSYGKDRGEDSLALVRLLKKIDAIEGISRIRLGSLEPMSLTDDFIEGLKGVTKLCPHFHLSLQSGCDKILSKMNRDYTSKEYLERVRKLRAIYPSMSLTTDIICGFPEETEEDFKETCDFVIEAGFTKVHTFPYSEREGTVAAKMPQVPVNVRKDRASRLIAVSKDLENNFAAKKVGSAASVLIETFKDGYAEGYTLEYIRAKVRTEDNSLKGKTVSVKAVRAEENTIICELMANG